eukprot:Opistho-2@24756
MGNSTNTHIRTQWKQTSMPTSQKNMKQDAAVPFPLLSACAVDDADLQLSSIVPPLGEWVAAMEDMCSFSPRDYGMMESVLGEFASFRASRLGRAAWVHGQHSPLNLSAFFSATDGPDSLRFVPFVERWQLPCGSRVAIWGDIHGSARSLARTLVHMRDVLGALRDDWTLAPGWHAAFLGDMVDRGRRSLEVIYTALRLHNANPGRVAIIRGNHEDPSLNAVYGLHEELDAKMPQIESRAARLYAVYRYMPAAYYLGPSCDEGTQCDHDYVQLSHGSWEMGYSPRDLLAGLHGDAEHVTEIRRLSALYKLQFDTGAGQHIHSAIREDVAADKRLTAELSNARSRDAARPMSFGLMWHDLIAHEGAWPALRLLPGRGLAYGRALFEWLVDAAASPERDVRLRGVVRGHQHNNAAGPMLDLLRAGRGIVDLYASGAWPSRQNLSVRLPRARWATTVLSAPESNFIFEHDSFAVITVGAMWDDWRLVHFSKRNADRDAAFVERTVHAGR